MKNSQNKTFNDYSNDAETQRQIMLVHQKVMSSGANLISSMTQELKEYFNVLNNQVDKTRWAIANTEVIKTTIEAENKDNELTSLKEALTAFNQIIYSAQNDLFFAYAADFDENMDQIQEELPIFYENTLQNGEAINQLQAWQLSDANETRLFLKAIKDTNNKELIVIEQDNKFYDSDQYFNDLMLNSWYISPTKLSIATNVITNSNGSEGLEDSGIFYEYIATQFQPQLDIYDQLINQAKALSDLYDTQYHNYLDKYENYNAIYQEMEQTYTAFRGSAAFEYYQKMQEKDLTPEEKAKVMKEYKDNVRKAWWKFLSLLDARYSYEKAKGMYR